MSKSKITIRRQRAARLRIRLKHLGTAPRLSVFRSTSHIYAQIIDDSKGHTLCAASSLVIKAKGKGTEIAFQVGQALAEVAKKAGVEKVYFDRGSYRYHGRIKALAEGARDKGLQF